MGADVLFTSLEVAVPTLDSIADLTSVITATVALGLSLWALWESKKIKQDAREADLQRQASQVVAWPVVESSGAGLGLIIRNGSAESISDVAVFPAARRTEPAGVGDPASRTLAGKPPQDYGAIPPGTHYVRFADDDEGGAGWQGTRLVDTSGGRAAVTLAGGELTALEPITSRRLENELEVLEFCDAAGQVWHRDRAGRLVKHHAEHIDRDRRASLVASEQNVLTYGSRPPNPAVQALVAALSERLCGRPLSPNEEEAPVVALANAGVKRVRRTQGKGQGLELHVGGSEFFYISGDKDGNFPNDGFKRLKKVKGQPRAQKISSLNESLAGHELAVSYWVEHLDELATAVMSAVSRSLRERPAP